MFKMLLKVDGVIYPITSLDLVDCEPFVASIMKDGKYVSYLNSKMTTDNPNTLDFEKALIVENSKYEVYEKLIEEGVKIYLRDLINHD